MTDAKSIALHYVLNHYGNLVSVEDPIFDDKSKTWITHIRTDYPRIIQDDQRPNEKILKFLSINKLGMLRFPEDFSRPVEATPREECVKNLKTNLKMWRERAEKIIVAASANQIARITETQLFLNPILKVISNLQKKEIIYDGEVESVAREERTKQYLELLEHLQLVRRIDNGYTYGDLLTALQEKIKDAAELEVVVLSHVLKESYSVLREIFRITQLEKFVHVDSCYYTPALEAEEILHLKRETIIDLCSGMYGNRDSLGITQILDKLIRADALKYEHPYYCANEKIFNDMVNMKHNLPELTSLRAGILTV